MSEQYIRKISLVVGVPGGDGLDLSELHSKFMVRRGDIQTPNSLDVRIYNPSDETVNKLINRATPGNTASPAVVPLSPEFTDISLSAGYQDAAQFGLIFQGKIIQCRFGRETQADTYIDIRAADGDHAYNFAVMNTTLAAGSTPTDHAALIAKEMGISGGYVSPLPATKLPRAKTFYGMGRHFARDLSKTHGMVWSIQDGLFQLVPLKQYVPGDVIVITSATGMINWPEQTANGIHIRCLLNPNIKIGRVVQVDNKSVLHYQFPLGFSQQTANLLVPREDADGYYTVWVAEHSGDTRGNNWYTDLICLTVDADIIPELLQGKFKVTLNPELQVVRPYG